MAGSDEAGDSAPQEAWLVSTERSTAVDGDLGCLAVQLDGFDLEDPQTVSVLLGGELGIAVYDYYAPEGTSLHRRAMERGVAARRSESDLVQMWLERAWAYAADRAGGAAGRPDLSDLLDLPVPQFGSPPHGFEKLGEIISGNVPHAVVAGIAVATGAPVLVVALASGALVFVKWFVTPSAKILRRKVTRKVADWVGEEPTADDLM